MAHKEYILELLITRKNLEKKPGEEWLDSCLVENELEVLINGQLNMRQQCDQLAKKADSALQL